jgi:hypothetical protein
MKYVMMAAVAAMLSACATAYVPTEEDEIYADCIEYNMGNCDGMLSSSPVYETTNSK